MNETAFDEPKKIFKRFTKEDIEERLIEHLDEFVPNIVSPIFSTIALDGAPEWRDYFVYESVLSNGLKTYKVGYSILWDKEDYYEDNSMFFDVDSAVRYIELAIGYMKIDDIEAWLDGNSTSGMLRWLLREEGIDHIPNFAREELFKFFVNAVWDLSEGLHQAIITSLKIAYEEAVEG